VHHGYVTQNQFLRVLNDLGLMKLLVGFERDNLVEKFRVHVGGRDDVDYINRPDIYLALQLQTRSRSSVFIPRSFVRSLLSSNRK
jgi:hypothetical protein